MEKKLREELFSDRDEVGSRIVNGIRKFASDVLGYISPKSSDFSEGQAMQLRLSDRYKGETGELALKSEFSDVEFYTGDDISRMWCTGEIKKLYRGSNPGYSSPPGNPKELALKVIDSQLEESVSSRNGGSDIGDLLLSQGYVDHALKAYILANDVEIIERVADSFFEKGFLENKLIEEKLSKPKARKRELEAFDVDTRRVDDDIRRIKHYTPTGEESFRHSEIFYSAAHKLNSLETTTKEEFKEAGDRAFDRYEISKFANTQ